MTGVLASCLRSSLRASSDQLGGRQGRGGRRQRTQTWRTPSTWRWSRAARTTAGSPAARPAGGGCWSPWRAAARTACWRRARWRPALWTRTLPACWSERPAVGGARGRGAGGRARARALAAGVLGMPISGGSERVAYWSDSVVGRGARSAPQARAGARACLWPCCGRDREGAAPPCSARAERTDAFVDSLKLFCKYVSRQLVSVTPVCVDQWAHF